MLKRFGMALLLVVAAMHMGVSAKDKEKDKGTVEVALRVPNGAGYTAPAAIVLAATASSSQKNHPVVQVQFYQGNTLLGTATQVPYTITWSNVAAGNYVLTAKGITDKGDIGVSEAVAINVNAPPGVSLTAPANGTSYTGPANIALTANATDSDGSIAKVEFFNGGTLIGTATSAPYAVNWSNVAPGNYTLTAKATDNQGAVTTSAPVGINVNAVPTVSLTAPTSNASYPSPATITLTANAADSDGTIAKVGFYQGTTLLGTATGAPYTFAWSNVAAGNYTLTAEATDNQGASATSAAVDIKVNTPPTVALTVPADSQTFTAPANMIIEAVAADSDGTIAKVDFFNGNTLLGSVSETPYLFYWTGVAAGSYTLTAKATDNLGGTSTSSPIAVLVVTNRLPAVSLSATPGKATAPATVKLSAAATDGDGTIAKVEFFQGATLLATVTQAPYRFDWSQVGEGEYALTAKATDDRGGSAVSEPVTVKVVRDSMQVYYIHADHLNTPRVITDSANRVVWEWPNEDPFGNNIPNENPSGLGVFEFNLRLGGWQYYDKETGLFYNGNRTYNPQTGTYLEVDPIGNVLYRDMAVRNLAARVPVSPDLAAQLYSKTPTYNQSYGYANQNPLKFIDPLGLYGTTDCSHYGERCKQSGGTDGYYCKIAPAVCSITPEIGNWTACVRQCLQDADKKVCDTKDGCVDGSCTTGAHVDCWIECAKDSSRPSPNLPK